MKLLTFDTQAGPRLGALAADGSIVDLTASGAPACALMQDLIEAGPAGLDVARAVLARS